jgi:hypothetical protein
MLKAAKVYIKNDQIGPVFNELDLGSGQPAFRHYVLDLGIPLILVVSKHGGGVAYVGQITVSEFYEDHEHPEQWKYRVKGDPEGSFLFAHPVPYDDNPGNARFVQLLDEERTDMILRRARV